MPSERSLRSILSNFFASVGSIGHRPASDVVKKKSAGTDSALEQSSIGIPRTALGEGATFGEKFTDDDLLFAIKREPVAFKTVFQVAHDIFDKWFEVLDVREKDKDEASNANVQAELSKLGAKDVFTQAAVYEHGFGYSIIVIGYKDEGETLEDEVKNAESIEDLAAYSPKQIGKVSVDRDYIEFMLGHKVSTYHDIQMKAVEFLRNVYAASGLSIKPKTQVSKIEALKEIIRTWGMNSDEILAKEAMSRPHRAYIGPREREEEQVKALSTALKEMMRKELLNARHLREGL